jgi:uncharacterized membrane protein YjjP (DUF1212 family)
VSAKNDPRILFLIDMGRALHSYGIPAHRLEDALGNTATRLGIRAEFFSGPTSLISSFGKPGEQHTSLSRVAPGQLQLDKLVELDNVVESLYRDEISVEVADARLHEIDNAPPRFGPVLTIIAFGLSSATVARFFAGGYSEISAALVLGLVTGALAVGLARTDSGTRIFEFFAAAMVTFLATAFSILVWPLSSGIVVIASLIVLLPGLALTLSLNELGTGHLVSGTARFAGAIMTFMKIGIGAAVGRQAAQFLPGEIPHVDPSTAPVWTLWVALFIVPAALSVLFRARRQELPWIAVGTTVAYWGTFYGVTYLGPLLGAAVGACLSGLAANVFARLKRRPAVVLVVPSLILLVPGSIGYSSLELMMESDVLSGLDTAVTTMLVGVSLVAGLLLSNVLVPPRNAL